MTGNIQLIGMSGSLRKGSYNTSLLQTATTLLPEGVTMQIESISALPLYNADLDIPAASHRPESVNRFRAALTTAHGIVVVSPEYNYSIPGALKNAIDWASRGEDSPMLRKPIAVMGVTPGLWGTVRLQVAFQPIYMFLDMKPVYKPEVLVAQAKEKFDQNGKLTDQKTIGLVRQKLFALTELIRNTQASNA